MGVQFYYVYKTLAHPEREGVVQPITLAERLTHVKEAQRVLRTRFHWICDTMDNQVKHALGDAPNSEFIIDPEGIIVRKRAWSNPNQVRADLEELVGAVEKPTEPDEFEIKPFAREKDLVSGIVPRVQLPSVAHSLRTEPVDSGNEIPYYVKLRAEADDDLLNLGKGTMYIGFHLDPIYRVHWNNLAEPLSFQLDVPKNINVSPLEATAESPDEKLDLDPREFLINVCGGFTDEPLLLTVRYIACDDQETFCVPVTQQYRIFPQFDDDGGWTFSRGRPGSRPHTVVFDASSDEGSMASSETNQTEQSNAATRISGRMVGHLSGWIDARVDGKFRGRFRGTMGEPKESTFEGQFEGQIQGQMRGRIDGQLDGYFEGRISQQ